MSVTVSQVAERIRGLRLARHRQGADHMARLAEHLPQLADGLRRLGASEVWLFGSLATGTCTAGSDVDLAVVGLPRAAYFDALAELMASVQAPVDLVRLEDAPRSLVARVHAEGRRL